MMADTTKRRCRVLVVGSARPRLAKVMALLLPTQEPEIDIEYLPCVATFDSYEDESGKTVRYLISVNYHGPDGTQPGTSLAPFFDQEPSPPSDTSSVKPRKNLGILGAAIGSGIEDGADVERIRTFFKTLRGADRNPLPVKVIQPNPEYMTMKEETEAFKALSPEAKEEMALQQSIGPGKMAKFVHQFSMGMVQQILLAEEEKARDAELAKQREQQELLQQQEQQAALEESKPPHEIDLDQPRYACRKCRTVLFGEADMQDPPHVPAQHQFSYRKHSSAASSCQSFFLADSGLEWMGDMSGMEGRFGCPKCKSKLGTWHWAGAQCSCGTWVSPAVQIPKSKVDTLTPNMENALPDGTVVSPFVVQHIRS